LVICANKSFYGRTTHLDLLENRAIDECFVRNRIHFLLHSSAVDPRSSVFIAVSSGGAPDHRSGAMNTDCIRDRQFIEGA
jgi:hypothetical protein